MISEWIKGGEMKNEKTIGITYYQIACETIRDKEKRIKELEAELNAVYKKLNDESND
jgi:hypothetical protein